MKKFMNNIKKNILKKTLKSFSIKLEKKINSFSFYLYGNKSGIAPKETKW